MQCKCRLYIPDQQDNGYMELITVQANLFDVSRSIEKFSFAMIKGFSVLNKKRFKAKEEFGSVSVLADHCKDCKFKEECSPNFTLTGQI